MTTPEKIIERLQKDFDCRLSSENIINILNVLEKRLAADILRQTKIVKIAAKKGVCSYSVGDCVFIRSVTYAGRQIFLTSATNPNGYTFSNGTITFNFAVDNGEICVEYIVFPKEITQENYEQTSLSAGDGHDEIYLYHVLSREALMDNDIERLNNYSLLYTQALNSLRTEVFNKTNTTHKFSNLW